MNYLEWITENRPRLQAAFSLDHCALPVNLLFFCSVNRTAPECGRIIVFLMHNQEKLPHLLCIMMYHCVLVK